LDLGVDLLSARNRSWGTVRICHLPVRTKMRHERHSLTTSARFRHSDKPKRNHDMAKRSTARALLSEYADDPPDSQATGQWGDWWLTECAHQTARKSKHPENRHRPKSQQHMQVHSSNLLLRSLLLASDVSYYHDSISSSFVRWVD
jgi:hypothetical protein